jgi:hypothetical protein
MRISWLESARVCLVDLRDDRAGLRDDAAVADLLHLREAGEIEEDAARERHGLPVIARARAARRDGDAEFVGGASTCSTSASVFGLTMISP